MEAARQRVKAAVACKKEEEMRAKEKEGASSSAPKAVFEGSAKREADGKDDRPPKKAAVTLGDAYPKKKSPPKLSHGADKRLMTVSGPVVEGTHHLLTHKDYTVKTIQSIIKSRDVDPYVEELTKGLRAYAFFDLSQVRLFS